MKSILDKSFRYTSAVDTDLNKTFARIRREQKAARQPTAQEKADAARVAILFDTRRIAK